MPDFDAINAALVTRFAAAAMTAPVGYDPIRVATGDLPGQMVPLPAVLVFPDSGAFTHLPGKRDSEADWTVRFYYDQTGDLPRAMAALRKWLTVLVDQLRGAAMLGGGVTSARIMDWSISVMPYAGVDYVGIELRVTTISNEGWSPTA